MIIVLTTVENKKDAEELAESIVNSKLGACVQIDEVESYYKWKGKFEKAKEFRLMIKTKEEKYKSLEEFIINNHKYEVPEILLVRIENGLGKYLNWMEESLK